MAPENWPGQVEFYIEHITDICFRASALKIWFPTMLIHVLDEVR